MRVRFRPHSYARLPAALGLLLSLASCSEVVTLGTLCPVLDQPCPLDDDAGGNVTPEAGADAAVPPLPAVDGALPAQPDAMPSVPLVGVFPAIRNTSFDSVGGAGDISTLSTVSVEPWYTCQPISGGDNPTTAVRAETSVTLSDSETPAGQVVTPRDGSGTFISMQYLVKFLPIPLVQELDQPLQSGEHYAVAVDVQSPNLPAMLSLQLRGSSDGASCLGVDQEVLVESDPVTTPGWQTLCLPFTASAEHTHLVLSLRSGALLGGALMTTSARLFFDNMRPATEAECPGL